MPMAVCAIQVSRYTNTFLSQLLYRQNCMVGGAREVVLAWIVVMGAGVGGGGMGSGGGMGGRGLLVGGRG